MTYDAISPSHYHGDRAIEPIDVIEDWNLNYRLGNALKYIARNGRKPGEDPREGLRKAVWYLEREMEALERPSGSYVPDEDGVYDEVLTYYGQTQDNKEAWPTTDDTNFGNDTFAVFSGEDVPFDVETADWNDFWQDTDTELYFTDTSVFIEPKPGPVGASGADSLRPAKPAWDSDDNYMWDPTVGPVELTEEDVQEALGRKDLEQFTKDEIVSTIEKRGFILGVKKDGSTCVLKDGRCE